MKWFFEDRVLVISTCALLVIIVAGWSLYGLLGAKLIDSAYRGESFTFLNQIFRGRSVTPLETYHREMIRELWVLTLVLPLFLAGAALIKARLVGKISLAVGSFLLIFFLLFCSLEAFPGLITPLGLNRMIEYYAHKQLLRPHDRLVYVFRDNTARLGTARFKGDSYSPAYGVQAPTLEFRWWDRPDGVVISRSGRPVDVAVFGDSYVDIGHDYGDTFGMRLAKNSGLQVITMGVGGYGPFQYLEMFATYGVGLAPRYAIFSFFEGNDIGDIRDYLGWKRGSGGYYERFDRTWAPPLWRRYLYVLAEFGELLAGLGATGVEILAHRLQGDNDSVHPELAVLNLGGTNAKVFFPYRNDSRSPAEMLETQEWRALGNILSEFRELSEQHGIVPIILYIPIAAHIYSEFSTDESGVNWRSIKNEQIRVKDNIEQAMSEMARRHNIRLISLTPLFEAAAREGKLLYYPFDSHWNSEGRELAAGYVAQLLRKDGDLRGPTKVDVAARSTRHQVGLTR